MKLLQNIYIAFFVLIISIALFGYAIFNYTLGPTSQNETEKVVEIKPGSINSIANTLYKENLIKSKFSFKLYVKILKKTNLKAATYNLKENMGTKQIVDVLYKGNGTNSNQIRLTFKEGFNVIKFAKQISEETNNTEEDVYTTLKEKDYLNSLIEEYWFLTNDILKDDIYYSLEGYLYPNTYYFSSKDVEIKEIIKTMLDETKKQLQPYQETINNHSMSIHEIFTLASIVELEGITEDDRKGIAKVFLNRLNKGMNLGSDVTTYYGAKVNMGDRDLYTEELNECNNYNTRCANFVELPISPISSPIIESIIAVLNPADNQDYYFVADKNKKIYFSKNINEHNITINKLKKEGLWYTYD